MIQNLIILSKLVSLYKNLNDPEMVKVTKATQNTALAAYLWGDD